MSNRLFRELEVKYVLKLSLSRAERILQDLHDSKDESGYRTCFTVDNYWKLKGKAQFIRVRDSWGRTDSGEHCTLKEVTVKAKDKGSNVDRLEVNAAVTQVKYLVKALSLALGRKPKRLAKADIVQFLKDGTVYSLCVVEGTTYLEVESPNLRLLEKHCKRALKAFKGYIRREPKSLYELYIK